MNCPDTFAPYISSHRHFDSDNSPPQTIRPQEILIVIRRRKVEPKYQSATDFYRVTTEKLENVNERSFVLLLRISRPINLFIPNESGVLASINGIASLL